MAPQAKIFLAIKLRMQFVVTDCHFLLLSSLFFSLFLPPFFLFSLQYLYVFFFPCTLAVQVIVLYKQGTGTSHILYKKSYTEVPYTLLLSRSPNKLHSTILTKVFNGRAISFDKQLRIKQSAAERIPVLILTKRDHRKATFTDSIASGEVQDKGSKFTPGQQVIRAKQGVIKFMHISGL